MRFLHGTTRVSGARRWARRADVARMERSEIRDASERGFHLPAFRSAPCGLRRALVSGRRAARSAQRGVVRCRPGTVPNSVSVTVPDQRCTASGTRKACRLGRALARPNNCTARCTDCFDLPLVPAKAGPRLCCVEAECPCDPWIPACAGMSGCGAACGNERPRGLSGNLLIGSRCSPDGAQRSPGCIGASISRSRIPLRSMRATAAC
jgi:hypothetical protein